MSKAFAWNDETVKMLFELAGEGRSVKEIGLILGTTVRSVTGKLHRERRGKAQKNDPAFKVIQTSSASKSVYTRTIPAPTLATEGVGTILRPIKMRLHKGKLIGVLDVTGCRWPVADNPKVIGGRVFCNAKKRDGSSYCCDHAETNRASYSRELIRQTVKATLHILKKRAA